ncbi:MAG: hypothetical protein ACTSRX_11875 [Promethearchaeota archaeon]
MSEVKHTLTMKVVVSYRDIQLNLKIKYGDGVSNTTLQNLHIEVQHELAREDRIKQLESELALYKQIYFELLETVKKNMPP